MAGSKVKLQRPCKKHRGYPQHGCPLCMQEIDSKVFKPLKW